MRCAQCQHDNPSGAKFAGVRDSLAIDWLVH